MRIMLYIKRQVILKEAFESLRDDFNLDMRNKLLIVHSTLAKNSIFIK